MTAPFAVVEFSGAVGTHNTEAGHSGGRDVAQMENADSYFINTYRAALSLPVTCALPFYSSGAKGFIANVVCPITSVRF